MVSFYLILNIKLFSDELLNSSPVPTVVVLGIQICMMWIVINFKMVSIVKSRTRTALAQFGKSSVAASMYLYP